MAWYKLTEEQVEYILHCVEECGPMHDIHDALCAPPIQEPTGKVQQFLQVLEFVCRTHGYVIGAQPGYDSTPSLEVYNFSEDEVRAIREANDCTRKE